MSESSAMQYRRFGKTELQMPVLSCGGMRYQYKWKDVLEKEVPAAKQENLEATVRRALELGINHIETARGYGTSEMQLGRILPQLPRDEMIVQTKVEAQKMQDEFFRVFDTSMNYLKLDWVDLFALHGINNDELVDWCLQKGGCLEAAQRLREEGRVKHIGFSSHARPEQIMRMIESDAFDYVNLHWYYIDQFNWPCIEAARARDMGVFIISPSDKGGMLYKPSERLVELCKPLSPIVFNDLYCLSRPEVHTISIGAACPGDFDEHMKALPLLDNAAETVAPIVERLDRAAAETLGEDWMQQWHKGLPVPESTPGEVNIPVILRLRNLALAYDMIDYGKMRYNLIGNAGHWFPGKNAANLDGLDFAECLADSPYAAEIPARLAETHELLTGKQQKRLSQSEG